MKHILENKNDVPVECFKMEIIEPIIISIIRFEYFTYHTVWSNILYTG
jgi:hypothetical protein